MTRFIRNKKTAAMFGLLILAFLAGAFGSSTFTAVGQVITNVFVTNTNSTPVPTIDAYSFTTYFKTFTADKLGQIWLTGIKSVKGFEKVSMEILEYPGNVAMTVKVCMGKLSGQTLGQWIDIFPLLSSPTIRTYDVNGPEFSVVLVGAPAYANVTLQAWVYLH